MPSLSAILRIIGVVIAAILPGGSVVLALAFAPAMLRRLRRFEPAPAAKPVPTRR